MAKWLDPRQQSEYIAGKHGLTVTPKKIANDRAKGKGPEVKYLGSTPVATPEALDDYAKRLLTDRSPHVLARERRQAAGQPIRVSPGRPRKTDRVAKPKSEARP